MDPWIIEHQLSLRGEGPLVKRASGVQAGGDTRKIKPLVRTSLPCIHLGPAVPSQKCGCLEKRRECFIHEECTTGIHRPGIQCCITCPDYRNVETADDTRRHLLYFIYPIAGTAWRRNIDWLRPYLPMFNGRRTVAITNAPATSKHTLTPVGEVREYLGPEFDTFEISQTGERRRGEVVGFTPLLRSVSHFTEPYDYTFYAHAKGVISSNRAPSTMLWAEMMHGACLSRWDRVEDALKTSHITGAFRRPASTSFPWHYSGTFYWFKNASAFSRDWSDVPWRYGGTEMWPSRIFDYSESSCLFGDNPPHHLYDAEFAAKTHQEYRKWMES